MKVIYTIGCAAILLTLACSKEMEAPTEAPPGEQHIFTLSLPDATKTALGEISGSKCPTLWSKGDQISIGGVLSNPLTAEEAGASTASFMLNGVITAPYNILYPGSESPDMVVLPAVQRYVEGSFDPAAVPLYAGSYKVEHVAMKHASAVLEIKLTGESSVKVRKLSVMASGGEYISGNMLFGKDRDGRFDGSFSFPQGSSGITLDCGTEGVSLGSEPTSFYVAVPSGTYKSGFYFIVHTTDGKIMKLEFSPESDTISPATLIRFPEREFTEDGEFVIIASEEDMMAFMNSHSKNAYLIVSDLDMSEYEWVPFNFNYTLDGGGHTIKGLKEPMFKEAKGTLKNIILDSEFTYSLNSNTTFGGTIGVFARKVYCTMENCVLRGKYTFGPETNETKTSTVYVGGFAGTAESPSVIRNCRNEADIIITSDLTVNVDTHIGGLFGKANSASLLEGNVNAGKVSVSLRVPSTYKSSGLNVGGVCGSIQNSQSSENVNKGEVYFDGVWQNSIRMGGVIGYLYGTETVRGDRNEGLVTAAPTHAETTNSRYGGVGAVYGTVTSANVKIYDAVNAETGIVKYAPESAPSYSFCVGGVIYAVDNKSTIASGLINKGKVVVDGGENTVTSSRRGIMVGGVIGTSVSQYTDNLVFDGQMDVAPLFPLQNVVGGIVGYLGSNDNSTKTDVLLSNCSSTSRSRITIRRKYGNKAVMTGMIVGIARNAAGSISNCTAAGTIESIGMLDHGSSNNDCHGFGGIVGRVLTADDQKLSISGCESSSQIIFTEPEGSNRVNVGGIAGWIDANDIVVENCSSSSSIKFNGSANDIYVGGIAGRLLGASHPMTALLENDNFTGSVLLSENGSLSRRPIFGGIVGFAGGDDEAHKLTLVVKECNNSGSVSREVSGISDMISSQNSSESIVGGILGSAGLRQVYETADVKNNERIVAISVEVLSRSSVDATIEDSSNSGALAINPTGGIEVSPNFTVSGGIVGVAATKNGTLLVKGCTNTGAVASESGTSGGILGHLYSNTSIINCTNSGSVYEPDADAPVRQGKGYVIAGGIVGSVNAVAENSLVEKCWNSGDVASSAFSAMNVPAAGGLVGAYKGTAVFKHCKTSGRVRNHPVTGSADLGAFFCGDSPVGTFEECAAGGYVARGGNWIPANSTWKNYAYSGGAGSDSLLPGCIQWDNVSKLPWEN